MTIILDTVVVVPLSLSLLSLSPQHNSLAVIIIVIFVSRNCGCPCIASFWAAMTALQRNRGDSGNGKGGRRDGMFTEKNGRQRISNKEHLATQKQVERMQ
jgi:hypothetical protein